MTEGGEKYEGTVKWFSNRNGYGFITPTSANAPTTEDIFVHKTAIVTDADYATLKEGFEASFSTYLDENGKLKAKDVTCPDGSPCPEVPRERPPRRKRAPRKPAGDGDEDGGDENGGGADAKPSNNRRNNRGRRNGGESGEGGGGAEGGRNGRSRKPPRPSWFSELDSTVQESMTARDIKVMGGRCFLAIGDTTRIKLGTDGYAALAHSKGLLAEGTYKTLPDGTVTIDWPKIIKVDGDEWKATTAEAESDAIVGELKLTDESILPTQNEETTEKLWGEGKPDPQDALLDSEFLMKRMVLFDNGRRGGRRPYRGNRGRNGNQGDGNTAAPAPASAD
eukprot:CAMPEP_0119549396 /NCGR_PEP_ID=MMETSP1352-20130426/3095_1 /TAXON_ID=265584 /ORGANISM="Stauroneis constricta, Strain CCMP1120" /LENGTH=335 /DNA_ID=CAMNT_0007594929 /DNA_START=78 /DNA_END=1085 /DNA_ORIENTATION=-